MTQRDKIHQALDTVLVGRRHRISPYIYFKYMKGNMKCF